MFRYFVLILIAVISFLLSLFSQEALSQNSYKGIDKNQINLLIPSSTRFVVNLAGRWEYSTDDQSWEPTDIPGVTLDAKKVYLRRAIKIDKNLASQYTWQLYFLGVDEQVEVYFNDQFIGKYFGGMTPFNVQIPKRLVWAETNNIKLVISAASDAARKLKEQHIFAKKIYTGILREIFLVGNPHVWINSIKYKTEANQNYQNWNVKTLVSVSTSDISAYVSHNSKSDSLNNLGISKTLIQVEAQIRNPLTGQVIATHPAKMMEVESFRTVPIDFNMNAISPSIWSTESPNLYQLVVKISRNGSLVDEYSTTMGFVDYSIQTIQGQPQVMQNGRVFELKGVDYIQDYKNGQAISLERMEQDVYQIKASLGANMIRVKYDVPHPYLAYLCDKYGLLMMVELPLYDCPTTLIELDEIRVKMRNMSERIIDNFHNHPSIMAWGLSDGIIDGTPQSLDLYKSLQALFRSYSDKLLYKIVWFGSKTITSDGFDFLGFHDNRRHHSSDGIKKEIARLLELTKDKPVFINFGFPIQPDNHHGYSDPLSIESQAYYILNLYHIVKEKKLFGSIVASFNDYELNNPLMTVNHSDIYLCTSGLVDDNRKQRLSFNTLQALFNVEKEPLLNAGSYSEKTPVFFIILGLILSIALIFLINRYKRFREYFTRAILRPYNLYADIRDQRIISNLQTLLLGISVSITVGLYLASILYYYKSDNVAQLFLILALPIKSIQEGLFTLIWIPEVLLLLITFIIILSILLAALIIRLFAFTVRGRIYYKDALTIVIWSAAPIVILLPFSTVLINLLVFSPAFLPLIMIILPIFYIWILFRILKATSVVFDAHPTKTFAIGANFIVVFYLVVFSIYQYQFSIFSYIQYIFQSLVK